MKTLTMRDTFCLVAPEVVAHRLKEIRSGEVGHHWQDHIHDRWWREVDITVKLTGICVKLGNVNQEASMGGYRSGWYNCRTIELSWEVVENEDFYEHFNCEPAGVLNVFLTLTDHLRANPKLYRLILQ